MTPLSMAWGCWPFRQQLNILRAMGATPYECSRGGRDADPAGGRSSALHAAQGVPRAAPVRPGQDRRPAVLVLLLPAAGWGPGVGGLLRLPEERLDLHGEQFRSPRVTMYG